MRKVLVGRRAVGRRDRRWLLLVAGMRFYAPGPSTDLVRIQVEQGASVRTVLLDLAKQGALRQPRAVELYLRISRHVKGRQPRIQVGMYEIPAGASPAQILELFDQGRVVARAAHGYRRIAVRRLPALARQSRRGNAYAAG